MNLNELAREIHKTAVEKGWWEADRNFGEMISLMHSELSEALESYRNGEEAFFYKGNKPEGYAVELIDCIIRILDALHGKVDIDAVTAFKMEYNQTRPYKHGGKKF